MSRITPGFHRDADAGEGLKAPFTDQEQVNLTLMINIINGWNRLAVGFGFWVEPETAEVARAAAV